MSDKRSESQFVPSNKETAEFLRNNIFGPAVGPSERRRRRAEGKKVNKAIKKSGGFPEVTKSEEDQIEEGFVRADMDRDWGK